jgi:hypothetical protein
MHYNDISININKVTSFTVTNIRKEVYTHTL